MRMITRVDVESGETLLWCGGEDFNIIQAQKQLNNSGMSLQKVQKDKWATIGHMEIPEGEEAADGR